MLIMADADAAAAETFRDIAGETLKQAYPGYYWGVRVLSTQGVMQIVLLSATSRYGFTLKLADIYSASDLSKEVMRAGGEMLERFGLSRKGLNKAEYMAKRFNARGEMLGETKR